jgi:hypothetical protein
MLPAVLLICVASVGFASSYFSFPLFYKTTFVLSFASLLAGFILYVISANIVLTAEGKIVAMEQKGFYMPVHDVAFDAIHRWIDPWLLPPLAVLLGILGLGACLGCVVRWTLRR